VNQTLMIDDGRIQREVILIGTTLVGRDPECEISHADPRLSRRHAEFRVTPDGVTLRDLGSRNGTHVNGQPIVEVLLTPGDTVQIAHLTIRFNDGSAVQTVQMAGGIRAAGRPATSPRMVVQDDRTRVISQADRAAAQVTTAVGLPMSALDDRTRVKSPDVARVQQSRPAARVAESTEANPAHVADVGEVMIRERAGVAGAPAVPLDLSVYGLAGTRWGRHVLLQGLALAALVLLLTATPLVAWEVRLYGSTVLSSWPVLLPVVAAAFGAGVAVASLIARTTARGLASQGR
jgi:hypothetical protein